MPIIIPIDELEIPDVYVSKLMLQAVKSQGLIEPIKLTSSMDVSDEDFDDERLAACKKAGMKTVIVTWPTE